METCENFPSSSLARVTVGVQFVLALLTRELVLRLPIALMGDQQAGWDRGRTVCAPVTEAPGSGGPLRFATRAALRRVAGQSHRTIEAYIGLNICPGQCFNVSGGRTGRITHKTR
ncbi:hypothetical protein GCM10008995_27970 [Halobellus salinus]|uniref:Uncharacterized protein n=1 Tax=Halobellus salinus TaxID=931585 RepID=A0A830EDY5_9EURY|nr:hypothetical protein GCM10008995_27970 [Halobellus salinus]